MSPSERIDALVAGDPPEADEQRLARLIYELQTATPSTPEALRGRIQALAETESARRPTLFERISLRRALLVLAPAIVIFSVGAAVVQGIVSASSEEDERLAAVEELKSTPVVSNEAMREATRRLQEGVPLAQDAGELAGGAVWGTLPTSRERAQDYRAAVRLRVDDLEDLSERTQQALRMTKRFGGYVVSVNYGNPRANQGEATLELRVPVGRVQEALVAFSDLGSIVSQDVRIRDLQGQIDRFTRDIRRLRDRISALRASLLNPNLTDAERARIESRLAQARARVASLEQERRVLARQGRFAKVSLGLTTQKGATKEAPGRIERAFDDAGSVLGKEVAFGLYALIVASPFLLLAGLAIAGARVGRRRADQRLLERA